MKKTLWIIGGVIVLIIFISIFSSSNNNTNKQSSVSETNQNNPSDQSAVDFKKVSLSNLPTNGGSLVETQGTITQKGEYTDKTKNTSYFLKIEDTGVAVLIMPKENILGNFKIGDLISVRGAVSTLGNCSSPDDPQIQKLCQQFKITSSNAIIILPIKVLSTDQDIIVLKKSTSNSTDSVPKSSDTSSTSNVVPKVQTTTIPQYQEKQLASINPQDKSELVYFKGNMDVSPIKITKDNGSVIYLMTLKSGGITATLQLNKYTAVFTGTKGDEVEVKGTVATPISFCHGTDQSLAYWCSLMDLQDGGLLIVPDYIYNLNLQYPTAVPTVWSTHY